MTEIPTVLKISLDRGDRWMHRFLFAAGATGFLATCVLVGAAVSFGLDAAGLGDHDSTDAPGAHSSLRPLTDHLTGCQYLETSEGYLTPRLGADHQPMCGAPT